MNCNLISKSKTGGAYLCGQSHHAGEGNIAVEKAGVIQLGVQVIK